MFSIEHLFGPDGPLASGLDNYEFRQGQLDMASAINRAIDEKSQLLVEAGTGVGKSFAYLVPFIGWALGGDKRVLISTYSKPLQEQLSQKDIPFLKKSLGVDFKTALCFGAENYLCLRRLKRTRQYGMFETSREAAELEAIAQWSCKTASGLKLELSFEPSPLVWLKVARESAVCRGKKCSDRQNCFYAKAKQAQSKAHLLIANHHLFFANIASGGRILPSFDAVVFDEAHNLEEVASSYFGFELTNTQLKYLLDEFHHPKSGGGFLHRLKALKKKKEIMVLVNAARQAGDMLFGAALDILQDKTAFAVREPNMLDDVLGPAVVELADAVSERAEDVDDEDDREELKFCVLKLKALADELSDFIEHKRERHVYWIEKEMRRRSYKCGLCASPVDISGYLKKSVFDKISPAVITSATLTVGSSFDFIKKRIGLDTSFQVVIPSSFDFQKQVLLYAPSDLPDPSTNETAHINALGSRIEKLLEITRGRAFFLFTSYKALESVYKLVAKGLKDYCVLKQGDLPRWKMLEKFKSDGRAVLFGTATFWQGVDVPGSALECVVITRLPFAVPDHPLTEARILDLEEKGENAFMGYQVPKAVLLFRQGVGRLIRHTSDVGIVAVLDPRVRTRHYGRIFLDSLPPCREVDDLAQLMSAYSRLKSNVA